MVRQAHPPVAAGTTETDEETRHEVLRRVIAAQEAERARVARDLHDDIGQALTSVLLGLRLIESALTRTQIRPDEVEQRMTDLRDLVGDALRRSRHLAFELRPTVLDDLGLVPALERAVADVRDRTGLQVDIEVSLPDVRRLPDPIETVSYRVVQEALTNVVRHADATSVKVMLEMEAALLRVSVEDDGCGFEVVEMPSRLGLVGIQERAELVDGSVEITSALGAGTRIELKVPLG